MGALQAYLTAIMAKDRVSGAVISESDYPVKLGECLDGLENIDRPFAKALTSLSFLRSDFTSTPDDETFPFLARLKLALTEGSMMSEDAGFDGAALAVPLDAIAARLAVFVTSGASYRKLRLRHWLVFLDRITSLTPMHRKFALLSSRERNK